MSTSAFQAAVSGRSVLVTETHVEPRQLVGRIGHSAFIIGGTRNDGGTTSGPDPYDLLAASLAACTVMTVRLYAGRKALPVRHVSANVAFRRGAGGAPDVFERSLVIEADDLDPSLEARLRQIADMCPVARTLARTSEIRSVLLDGPRTTHASSEDYVRHVEELPIPNVDW